MLKGKKFTEVKAEKTSVETEEETNETSSKPQKRTKEIILLLFIFLLLAALGVVGYLYIQERNKPEDTTQAATEEVKRIKEDVGKLILLPEDVEPTIATITDVERLREENADFYKDAENGDILLIYPKRAIIYSPSKNIIVNVAPIIRQPTGEGVQPETEEQTPDELGSLNIELRNGSTTGGVTNDYEDKIEEVFGDTFTVTGKNDAMNKKYTGVVVYDLTGGAKEASVQALAEELSATIETILPTGEASSEADVVIIIGN
ncbi:LytR C-terminal domain-containing protein [Candidatus Dojkabacteria bacterium]|nr:LytR C-terminal domain-containing protein [Candidatus Dojkabacteria bacterium]